MGPRLTDEARLVLVGAMLAVVVLIILRAMPQ